MSGPATGAGTLGRGAARGRGAWLEEVRLRAAACGARWSRWEFWPAPVVYAPLLPWLAWLGLRHGGLTTCTAANPCMPMGGLVGESKWSVLSRLPAGAAVCTALIEPGPVRGRLAALDAAVARLGLAYPVVLKPDVGERGAGVRRVQRREDAAAYLGACSGGVLVQRLHPGPHEAGIFYVRRPGRATGEIFSITVKRFPVVVGDGRSTLRALILRHERYRLQAGTFLARLGARADEVPGAGREVRLAFAGNHCQGTMFLDGAGLITARLTAAVDAMARAVPGLCFGRFDVRYADPEAFARGRGLSVVEVNGLLSESTNIYDPGTTFWQGQRTLRRQWALAYEIGSAHRADGAEVASAWACARAVVRHVRRGADRAAD